MGGREPLDVEALVRENENLREQRLAVDEVLRAVARPEGLQPVLDAIISAAAVWTAIGLLAATSLGTLFFLGARIDGLGAWIDGLAARIDARFDRVDARFDRMDERFDAIAARLDAHLDHHPT
jgi:hypothetical protein